MNTVETGGSPSFECRVQDFLEKAKIGDQHKQHFKVEIVRLFMQTQDGLGSIPLRKMSGQQHCLSEFVWFKNQYLDVSHYLHRVLWPAVLSRIEGNKETLDELESDVQFCLEYLPEKDKQKLKANPVSEKFKLQNEEMGGTWTTGEKTRKDLLSYVRSKVHALSFLSKYDPAFDKDDFAQDLVCEALRVFNIYPRSKGRSLNDDDNTPLRTRVEKYIETALNNKVMNLKEFYTCESRRRVCTTNTDLYKKRAKLKKLLKTEPANEDLKKELVEINKKIKNNNSDYYSRVSPLVKREDGEDQILDVSEDESRGIFISKTNQAETNLVVDSICDQVDERVARFVKLISGAEHDDDFEAWASENGIDTNKFDTLVRGAKKFFGLKNSELRENPVLRKALGR